MSDNDPSLSKAEIAQGYDQIPAHLFMPRKFHRRCVALVTPHLQPGAAVVDLGCGQGTLLQHLQSLPLNLKLSACDLSPVLVANSAKAAPKATVKVGDLEALPFANAEFDAAFATEVLEHLIPPDKALSEIFRVIKPGGWLLVSLPNRDWFHFEKREADRNKFQPVDDHYYRVSEVEALLIKTGFRIDKVRGGENLYFGGGLLHALEKVALAVYPPLYRRMKRMVLLAQKPL